MNVGGAAAGESERTHAFALVAKHIWTSLSEDRAVKVFYPEDEAL